MLQNDDITAWKEYKKNPNPTTRTNLLNRFDGIINNQVNKWAGAISRDILLNEGRLLALKAFDTYKPESGTQLSTHVTNQLLPLSRTVYTYQNAARMPENITQKVNTFNNANEMLKVTLGRDPTTDELHNELGWSSSEITRIRDYNKKDLLESGPKMSGAFFSKDTDTEDDIILGGIYFELTPDEKRLFEYTTGYNGAKVLSNTEAGKKLGLSQAQLSYKKSMLRKKIEKILSKQHIISK